MKRFILPLVLFGGLLSACGGGHHDDDGASMGAPAGSGGGGGATADNYTSQVAALVLSVSEDAEPAALDESAPSMPEDSEPQAVQ